MSQHDGATTSRSLLGGLAGVAFVCVVIIYGRTISYGLRYDDYHTVRPWTWAEVVQVTHGTWDPTHVEVVFYRPIAAWWYALRFAIFGMNLEAQHAISVLGMMACAFLAGVFVWRETASARTAVFATGLYAIYPALPSSQGVWLTNQMHMLASLTVLIALLCWQRARTGPASAWWPLLVLQIIAAGIKEDTLMLAPLLLVLTVLRRLLMRDVPWPAWPIAVAAFAVPVGLFGLRYEVLGRIGGYGALPPFPRAFDNVTNGLLAILRVVPAKRPWQLTASIVSQTILVAGILASAFRRRQGYVLALGLIVAVSFDLPFAFVSKAEQYHLVALGAVLALTGGISAILELIPAAVPQAALTAVAGLACVSFVPVAQSIVSDFKPCSSITLNTDRLASDWGVVPPEMREWLATKPAACRTGLLVPLPDALTTSTWAYGFERDGRGDPFQWTSDHAVIGVNPRVTELSLRLRAPTATPDHPVTITVRGSQSDGVTIITNPGWHSATLQPLPGHLDWLRRMRWIDLEVSPVFVPSKIDPASRDSRPLGLQLWVAETKR
jgi:hypothetical protein